MKETALALYNVGIEDESQHLQGVDSFVLRCPTYDFGEIVSNNTILEDLNLHDDKEFYL